MKNFTRRELYAFGETLGESATRLKPGGRVYGGGGGVASAVGNIVPSSGMFGAASPTMAANANMAANPATTPAATTPAATTPTQQSGAFSQATATPSSVPSQLPQTQADTQQGIADWAQPYLNTMLGATQQQLFNYDQYGNATGMQGYNPYSYNPADYFAGFTPLQQQAQQGISNLVSPWQTDMASGYLSSLIGQAGNLQYQPTSSYVDQVSAPYLQQYQMQGPQNVSAPGAQAAQLGNAPTAQATTTQAAELGQTPLAQAATTQAAQIGAAPTVDAAQMQGPQGVGYQNVSANTVNAPNLQNLQMQAAGNVNAPGMTADLMQAAQTGFNPNLNTFQMGPAQQVGTQDYTGANVGRYMDPYMQQVVGTQQREAKRQSDIMATQQGAQAAQAGAFGGSRQAIMEAERRRNLATQLGNIQATGSQAAFQNAQQQFNTQQQAALQAQLANQQAGLTTGQQNLAAQLGVQQLGTQTGMQTALANLNNQQQAAVQNQAARLQASGMNATQAMQAALANQQNQQQANLQNLSAGLQTQGLQAQTGLQAQQLNQSAGLQAALANQQAGVNTGQFNAQQQYNTALQNAQMQQQANLANQGLMGQYGLQQGQFGQAANLANQQAQQQTNLANQGLLGQYGLTQGQFGQAANLANQQAMNQFALANQGLAGQYGLQQGQFGQAANMLNAQQGLQAALANQQAGLTTGQQNLNALLGIQQLGSGQGMQAALANQQAQQAANQLMAQQNQFGANLGLQGLQAAMSGAGQLGGMGSTSLQNQLGLLNAQQATGLTQQQQQQNIINQAVQNYQTAQQYPMQQLSFMKNMMSGLPYSTSSTQNYSQAPSMAQNLAALGMGAYGLNQMMGGGGGAAGTTGAAGAGGGGSGLTGLLNSVGGGVGGAIGSIGSGIGGALNGIGGGIGNAISGLGSGISSGLSTIGGWLGLADGGQVHGYADGGSVESPGNVANIVDNLSDQQLQQALQAAQARGDMDQLQAVQHEMAMRASERGGLAGAFNQLPAQAKASMAKGGMVAFSGDNESLVQSEDGYYYAPPITAKEMENADPWSGLKKFADWAGRNVERDPETGEVVTKTKPKTKSKEEPPTPYGSSQVAALPAPLNVPPQAAPQVAPRVASPAAAPARPVGPDYIGQLTDISNKINQFEQTKPEDQTDYVKKQIAARREALGENPAFAAAQQMIEQSKGEREQALGQGRGLAALMAMQGMLEPGGFVRGLGKAGGAFAQSYGKALDADRAEQKAMQQAQINLANAQYSQKVGDYDSAQASYDAYKKSLKEADAFKLSKLTHQEKVVHDIGTLTLKKEEIAESARGRAASAETSIQKIANDLMRADKTLGRKEALNEASRIAGYSFRTEASGDLARTKLIQQMREKNPMYGLYEMQKAQAKTPQEVAKYDALLKAEEDKFMARMGGGSSSQSSDSGMKIVGVR